MGRPTARPARNELVEDLDTDTLGRLHQFLYREYVGNGRFWWQLRPRTRRIGTALDVLNDVQRELREQGRLRPRTRTMFTPEES